MTDDEIIDECRKRYAMAREEYEKAYDYYPALATQRVVLIGAQLAVGENLWNRYANAAYGFTDTGDETLPSEVNPVPIEEIYSKPEETLEEKQLRLWNAIKEFAQG